MLRFFLGNSSSILRELLPRERLRSRDLWGKIEAATVAETTFHRRMELIVCRVSLFLSEETWKRDDGTCRFTIVCYRLPVYYLGNVATISR